MRAIRLLCVLATGWLLSPEATAQSGRRAQSGFAQVLAKQSPALSRLARRGPQQTVSRPGRGVRYEWDDNTRTWSTSPSLETYTYDSRANLIQETFADSASARPTGRSSYTYDAQNRKTEELYQRWQNGAWENAYRYTLAYDAQGNMTQELDQEWSSGAWATTGGYQSLNTYTAGVLTEQTIKQFNNGAFENDQRLQFTVANGQWTEVVLQDWKQGAWQNDFRIQDIVWHNWAAQQPASYREQEWQGAWENSARYTSTYAPNGTTVSVEEQPDSPTTWALHSRTTDSFDNFGNYLGYRVESRQNNAWVLEFEERDLLLYTATNDVRRRTSQVYSNSNGATFENQSRYNYSSFQSITLGTAPAALVAHTQLYPNPAGTTATLTLSGLQGSIDQLPVQVLNLLGQPVITRTAYLRGGVLRESLDLSALPGGTYLVRIATPAGTITKRLVRQ